MKKILVLCIGLSYSLFAFVNTTLDPDYGYLYNIKGLDYKCSQGTIASGVTGDNGSFVLFEDCSKFEFSLNNKIRLGEITKEKILQLATTQNNKIIFLTDIQGVDSFESDNSKIFDTLQLLQTLDKDLNPYNGIEIDATTIKSNITDFIYERDFSSVDLNKWIQEAYLVNPPTLIPTQCARANFEYFLRTNIFKKDSSIDTVGPCDITLGFDLKAIAADKAYIEIFGEADSEIILNGVKTGKKLVLRDGDFTYPNGIYEEFELDTNIFFSTFNEFNLTLEDQNGFQTQNAYELRIFNDTDQPYLGNIDYNITTTTQNIIDLNITDSSKNNGLSLSYEINDTQFEITDDEVLRFVNPSPSSGTYSFSFKVEDEALHREEKVFWVTVP